jgi:hypothetical protein
MPGGPGLAASDILSSFVREADPNSLRPNHPGAVVEHDVSQVPCLAVRQTPIFESKIVRVDRTGCT